MVRAKRSLGQNFLRDESVVERIVSALDLTLEDTVIEIGPGLGALTASLVERAKKVVAVEFDRDMVAHLRGTFAKQTNLEIHNADALDVDFSTLAAKGAKLVANLPYNISTPILQRLIEQREMFDLIVLMFQREVADRITAQPGLTDRGYLTVLVEDAFVVERLFDVSPTAFQPVPKVWSSVVRLVPHASELADRAGAKTLLSTAFSQKRKTILNNLKRTFENAAAALVEADIDKDRRAETLTRKEWVRLSQALEKTLSE
jgi:16S rRNA (adenine1518-N6/adenine1519-N6)-dimethyltransferase